MFDNLTITQCSNCGKDFSILNTWKKDDNICLECGLEKSQSTPTEIIIKSPTLEIQTTNHKQIKLPKPNSLNEFIGQKNNKQSVRTAIKMIQKIKPINIFIHSAPGCGKSTLAEIIAKELNAEFIYTIPEQLKDIEKIKSVLNQIQTNSKLTVWMLDECHTIDRRLINILLPVLQDGQLGNTNINPFVFIGATTDYHKLYKKSEALISRFQVKINLDKYTDDEMVLILKQYKTKLNIDVDVSDSDYLEIAKNSKNIPREAINLLLKRLVLNNVDEVLIENKIIKDGLNETDIKILKYLNTITTPIGANFLSQCLDIHEDDYLAIYEPFLVSKHFIKRTRTGRLITDLGKQFLNQLNKGE